MSTRILSLRERLTEGRILVVPGAYDALTARLVELSGFEAVYLSGAGVSYSQLASPDMGLVTQTEMIGQLGRVANAVNIPVLADGDTGFGNAMNVRRSVQLYESAGASAIQLEDQSFPKRCGHLGGKELIPLDDMLGKVRAACDARRTAEFLIMARTDALATHGMDEALKRGRAFIKAGADMLFIEAATSERQLIDIADTFPDIPLVANMVEGGQTPLLSAARLEEMGYAIALFPNSLIRMFARAGQEMLSTLREEGTTESHSGHMMMFTELNGLLGLDKLHALEEQYLPAREGSSVSGAGP